MMKTERIVKQLNESIFRCRTCTDVIPSVVPRSLEYIDCGSKIVLMAQAPSEGGVRETGHYWVNSDLSLRPPGGPFLDKYLRILGYSIDPKATEFRRPYSTNVFHCWPGINNNGRRDRSPTRLELSDCNQWWLKEIELIKPRVIILLGKIAAETVEAFNGERRKFRELLLDQGADVVFGNLATKRFVLPHPTSSYKNKSEKYQAAIDRIKNIL